MVKQEKKFYSDDFTCTAYKVRGKDHVITAYQNSNESVATIAQRFGVKLYTVSSWIYRRGKKNAILATSNSISMKKEKLSPEAMELRIRDLENELSNERMRSESLSKMIEIAERELKIDIRKKSGVKQSLR